MHPEIEKLIDFALADGQITEKERNVIFKKATDLGIDTDEVEMILDGKLHQLEANKPKQKEKIGSIKVCPACGGHMKNMDVVCTSCGHEISGTDINQTMQLLINQLSNSVTPTDKAKIISSFSVPNEKSVCIDFLNYLLSHVISGNVSEEDLKCNDVLKQKAIDTINRMLLYFKQDSDIISFTENYNSDLDKKFNTSQYLLFTGKTKQRKSYLWTTTCLVIFFGVFIILKKFSPNIEDQRLITSKIWPFWLLISVITIAIASYYNIEWKKHKKRFPFLEKYN
jgi:hypothetical protein